MVRSSPGGKDYLQVSTSDSVERLFSRFRYNPTSTSPPSHPWSTPCNAVATNRRSRKGRMIERGNKNDKKNRKRKKKQGKRKENEVEEGNRVKKRKKEGLVGSGGKEYHLHISARDSDDHLFSQFRFNPCTASPPSCPCTPPLSTTATNKKSRKGIVSERGRKGGKKKNAERKKKKQNKKRKNEKKVEDGGNIRKKRKREKLDFLTSKQRWSEPYRRVPDDHPWVPPSSPYGLIQEHYYHDPWKVLVICALCNRTRGSQTEKIIHEFFSLCPSAEATIDIPGVLIENKIRHLGLQKKRSVGIIRLSKEYLGDWTYVTQLHGVGKYAADAYAIFCSGYWRDITPVDHKLVDYWRFLHDIDETSTTLTV